MAENDRLKKEHELISHDLSKTMEGLGYIVQNQLIETRHWTKELIAKWLGDADQEHRNPHNDAQAMKWYSFKRVQDAEARNNFQRAFLKANQHRMDPQQFQQAVKQLNRKRNEYFRGERKWNRDCEKLLAAAMGDES